MIPLTCKSLRKQTHRNVHQIGGCQGRGVGELGEGGQKVQIPVLRQMCSGNVMYSMMTVGNKTVVHI